VSSSSDGAAICAAQRVDTARARVGTKALLVVIANGRIIAIGFTVAPDAIIDDGLLTTAALP